MSHDELDSPTTQAPIPLGGAEEEEQEAPHAPARQVSWPTASLLLIADIVGIGVLSLPSVMAQLGWFAGIIFIVLFYFLNLYPGWLLYKIKLRYPQVHSHMDIAMKTSGKAWAKFSAVIVYVHIFVTLGDYLLVFGESLGLIFFDSHVCQRDWIFFGCLILFPFLQIRLLHGIRRLCWVNMLTITSAILFTFGYVCWLGPGQTLDPDHPPVAFVKNLGFLDFWTALSKIAFAYAGQFLYVEIISEMEQPRDFPKSVAVSGVYQVLAYVFAACFGYAFKGALASGMIINYIPFNPWLRLVAFFLFSHMVITYLVKSNVLARAVHRFVSPKRINDTSMRGKIEFFAIGFAIMISAALLANLIPFFESLTGLIGALFVPIACWILPVYFYYAAAQWQISRAEKLLMGLVLLCGLVLTVCGTVSNFKDIVDTWSSMSGAPFGCHCEGIWNTCECSASHTGMVCPS